MAFLKKGEQWPRTEDIERLAKYKRMNMIFKGVPHDLFKRARDILAESPVAAQLDKLYIAVNLMDVLTTKPADILVGKGVAFESGQPDASPTQKALNSIVEENEVNKLVYEAVVSAGITGDAWFKTYYDVKHDLSVYDELGLAVPTGVGAYEPVIESVPAQQVFPELKAGSKKQFRAVNIAALEHVEEPYGLLGNRSKEKTYLNVERHLPGYILYERYELIHVTVNTEWGAPISEYVVKEQVATGRQSDMVVTGCREILVRHAPYKASTDSWQGIGNIEKLEETLMAINDRLMQIDYILWKHADPTAYGPSLDNAGNSASWGGKYVPTEKEDVIPGYMTWNSQLGEAFKQLDYLLSLVFQQSETPQWLFGTTITQDKGGTGTSHSDGRAIEMRLLPITSKVRRIKMYVEPAIRDVLWLAQELEVYANRGVGTFKQYKPEYPAVKWDNPIPSDPKEDAEVAAIRTGNRQTLDTHSAIKRLDGLDDLQAREIASRIKDDELNEALAQPSVFNGTPFGGEVVAPDEDDTGTDI
jgi:hypothetical protein